MHRAWHCCFQTIIQSHLLVFEKHHIIHIPISSGRFHSRSLCWTKCSRWTWLSWMTSPSWTAWLNVRTTCSVIKWSWMRRTTSARTWRRSVCTTSLWPAMELNCLRSSRGLLCWIPCITWLSTTSGGSSWAPFSHAIAAKGSLVSSLISPPLDHFISLILVMLSPFNFFLSLSSNLFHVVLFSHLFSRGSHAW